MPTFDIVSQVDMQEVRNAVDQAQRELSTRFDFKGTESTVELHDMELRLHSATEDRLRAVVQVVEEKLVKRKVSLKALDYGKPEEAAKGTMRQTISLKAGISSDNAKTINRWIKESNGKKVSSTTQGDSIRVSGKKRDDLQTVIAGLREQDFGIPLQFENFRE
jgi:cyclic-di-GMP-binding protein